VARRLSIHARRRQRGSDHLEERRKKGARGVSHPHARPRLLALEEREGGCCEYWRREEKGAPRSHTRTSDAEGDR
jgi:hypothetical protein